MSERAELIAICAICGTVCGAWPGAWWWPLVVAVVTTFAVRMAVLVVERLRRR